MMRNPVFESSMKRRMRSLRSPLLLTLYILFLLLVSVGAVMTLQRPDISLTNLRAGLETYAYVSIMQFALIVLVAPALTAASISGERERQTLDLLLCTRVGAARIVLGKLFSSLSFLALLIVSSMPVMALAFFFGGIGFWDMMLMQLFLLVTAFACCSIGIFASSVFKRTVTATVVSYLTIFALGVGTIALPFLFQTEGMSKATEAAYTYYASATSVGGIQQADATFTQVILSVPKLFFLNPAVGLFALVVNHTGLLQRTFGEYMGWRGSQLYELIGSIKPLVWINMGVLALCGAVLTGLSVLFVKPSGRKVKRRK